MTFLPIVQRELVLASRRSATYWTRFWAAAAVAVITFIAIWTGRGPSVTIGRGLFTFLEVLSFIFCATAGVRYTADALSAERREGTLGLLFLTNLRGHDVVLGKLVVFSLDAVFAVLAISPVLAIPLLLGGITGAEFNQLIWFLLNTLFWSLSVGLIVSSIGLQDRTVTFGTLVALLVWMLGLPLLWQILHKLANPTWLEWLLLWPSPAYAFRHMSGGGSTLFWNVMLTVFCLSLGCIAGAAWLLPRSFRDAFGPGKSPVATLAREDREAESRGFAERSGSLDRNPVDWAARRGRGLRLALRVVGTLVVAFALWVQFVLDPRPPGMTMAMVVYTAFGLHLLFKFLLAFEACRAFNDDRRSGALELLLCTPLDPNLIVRGHARRLAVTLLPFLVSLLLLNFATVRLFNAPSEAWMPVCGLVALCFDGLALLWLGLWRGLAGRGMARTAFSTYFAVMLPPWAVFALFLFAGRRAVNQDSMRVFLFLWTCGVMFYDLVLAVRSRGALLRRFRSRAAGG